MDLLGFFRDEHTASELLCYIDRLPGTSHYIATLADDEEAAAMAGDEDDDAAPATGPRLTDYGPEVRVLSAIYDLLAAQLTVQVTPPGKRPKQPSFYPRPVTAAQRIRQRQRIEQHHDLVRRVLPDRG